AMRATFTPTCVDSSDPPVSGYELTAVAFIAAGYGVQYRLSREVTYQVGGKEALLRDMSLAVQIDSSTNKLCFFTNDYRDVRSAWPRIGPVVLTQTNGTAWEQYFLTISAAPTPRFTSVMPDAQT